MRDGLAVGAAGAPTAQGAKAQRALPPSPTAWHPPWPPQCKGPLPPPRFLLREAALDLRETGLDNKTWK